MITNSVLTVLRLSLLFLNHLQTLEKAGIISSCNSCDVRNALCKLVSSAYIVILASWTKAGRSFI